MTNHRANKRRRKAQDCEKIAVLLYEAQSKLGEAAALLLKHAGPDVIPPSVTKWTSLANQIGKQYREWGIVWSGWAPRTEIARLAKIGRAPYRNEEVER